MKLRTRGRVCLLILQVSCCLSPAGHYQLSSPHCIMARTPSASAVPSLATSLADGAPSSMASSPQTPALSDLPDVPALAPNGHTEDQGPSHDEGAAIDQVKQEAAEVTVDPGVSISVLGPNVLVTDISLTTHSATSTTVSISQWRLSSLSIFNRLHPSHLI